MDGKVILLVEDNQDDIDLTLRAFQKNKLANSIDVVNDGAEALDYIFCQGQYSERTPNNLPSVVLLDLKLPKIDGLEVLKQLRENKETRLLPIVILTSSREQEDLINGYTYGANSYIVKPVDFDKFSEAIKHFQLYWLLTNESPPSSVR